MSNCDNCTNSNDCQLCTNHYIFNNGSCIVNCNNITNCIACNLVNNTIICNTCILGYNISANICG